VARCEAMGAKALLVSRKVDDPPPFMPEALYPAAPDQAAFAAARV